MGLPVTGRVKVKHGEWLVAFLVTVAGAARAGSIGTGFMIYADTANVVTGQQSNKIDKATDGVTAIEASTSNWNSAYAHVSEPSNTVHGGFIRVAYDWATNAYAYAGRAWAHSTNVLANSLPKRTGPS